MFNKQSVHIAMLLWGCIFNLIAALCMFLSKNFDKYKRIWLIFMQLVCAILLFGDAFAWGFRGAPGMMGYVIVRISNFIVFLFSDVMALAFHGYMCCCFFEKTERNKRPLKYIGIVFSIAVLGIILVIVSQFTGLYYYFDADNFYHRNTFYIISVIIPLFCMLADLFIIIKYRKNVSSSIFVSMITYIVLPLVATLVQIFYYGISLINIGISISMILVFVVAVMEQSRLYAQKEKEAAELKINIMISQITPHFIYNALSTIQEMCCENPKMAEETVGEFAEFLRGNISFLNNSENITFSKELSHVKYYLAIEKKRFADRLNVEYDIRNEEFLIPPLTLQLIVENAVKHGICKKKGGGTLKISSRIEDGYAVVNVEDDGVGFDVNNYMKDGNTHIGIENVRNRLKKMCGGSLFIESTQGIGTKVCIKIPVSG